MLFSRVTTLLTLLGAAAAAPSADLPKQYRLKTKVVTGDDTKNNLYGTHPAPRRDTHPS